MEGAGSGFSGNPEIGELDTLAEHSQKRATDSGGDAEHDVPHGPIRIPSGQRIAQLIERGIRGVIGETQQHRSDDERDHSQDLN
jgi:hypothetical protein